MDISDPLPIVVTINISYFFLVYTNALISSQQYVFDHVIKLGTNFGANMGSKVADANMYFITGMMSVNVPKCSCLEMNKFILLRHNNCSRTDFPSVLTCWNLLFFKGIFKHHSSLQLLNKLLPHLLVTC